LHTNDEKSFSIELKAKEYIKTINLTNGVAESVVIEGTIGQFLNAEFAEDVMLEIVGKKGILRIDLSPDQIKNQRTEVKTL
jgi:hypothetical protein